MKITSLFLSGLIGCVTTSPVGPPNNDIPNEEAAITPRALPSWGRNIYNGYTFQGDANYNGWVIKLVNTYQFRFTGSTWAIPTDIDGAYWLAYQFANTLATWNHGNQVTNHDIGGGWCVNAWTAKPEQGWNYAGIPTKLLADWVLGHAANYVNWGSPGPRNAMDNSFASSNNEVLFTFRLAPCQHSTPTDKLVIFQSAGNAPYVVGS